MTLKRYDYEQGTDAANLTTGLTGAQQVTIQSGVGQFSTAAAMSGSLGAKITNTGSGQSIVRYMADAPNKVMAYMCEFSIVAGPALTPLTIRHSSGVVARIAYLPSGGDRSLELAGSGWTRPLLAAGVFQQGSRYRIEARFIVGNSTNDGQATIKIYDADTGDQVGSTMSASNLNLGTNPIAGSDVGVTSPDTVAEVHIGHVAFNDGSTQEIGPPPATVPPTAGINGSQLVDAFANVALTGSITNPDSVPIVATRFVQMSGPTVTINQDDEENLPTTATFTAPAGIDGTEVTFRFEADYDNDETPPIDGTASSPETNVTVRPHNEWLVTETGLAPLRYQLVTEGA